MGRQHGVTTRQLEELARYRDSPAFSDEERLVIDLAVEMAKTPVPVPPDLMAELRNRFDDAQLVELVASIAWENFRARFNRPFGIDAVGFSAGAACAVPEVPAQRAPGPA